MVLRILEKPLVLFGMDINRWSPPSKDSAEALRRIENAANLGLKRVPVQRAEAAGGELHTELDRRLAQNRHSEDIQQAPTATTGEVAHIPSMPRDPEVTRARSLQARVDATDWRDKAKGHQTDLARKLSAFAAVWQMRERAGIPGETNLTLLKIVEEATRPEARKTVWELFNDHYPGLTWLQKLKAGWNYWAYYQTSLISNTVETYLGTLVQHMTADLFAESNTTRLKMIQRLLENTNEFLTEDRLATLAFAYATHPGGGDLEKHRKEAIENYYSGSLEDLCRAFSEKWVDQNPPTVPFFRKLKAIPVVGLLFELVEWLLNRFIIRSTMKFSILPPTLKSAIENGLEATEAHNPSFALALTRFFNARLEDLRDSNTPSETLTPLAGTALLPAVIKNLHLVLRLEPFNTQPELQQKFQEERVRGGKWSLDAKVEEAILEGVREAGDLLLHYLNKSAQSGELFSHLLELACAPFSGQSRDQAALLAELREEQKKLKRTADEVFDKIVETAIERKFSPTQPEDKKGNPEGVFSEVCITAETTFAKLADLCGPMTEKIDRAIQAPTADNTVQGEIAAFLHVLKAFASRQELNNALKTLEKGDQEAILRIMTPLCEGAARLGQKLLRLQELQEYYPAHTAIADQLKSVAELLESLRNPFHDHPRHNRSHLIQNLEQACEEVDKRLGAQAPATLRLKGFIQSIGTFSDTVVKEQQVLDALKAFYPPRLDPEERKEGLLDQLLRYEQGTHPPGFQLKSCLNEIATNLEYFPPEEQAELRQMIGKGTHLHAKWDRLGALLQRIYTSHKQAKDTASTQFDEVLKQTEQWTQEKRLKYTLIKAQDHTDMQTEMKAISAEVKRLCEESAKARPKLNLPFYVSPWAIQAGTAAIGGAAGWGLVSAGSFLGPLGAAAGAGLAALAYSATQNWNDLINRKAEAIGKTVASVAGWTAASYLLPSLAAPLIGASAGAFAGKDAKQAAQINLKEKVSAQVKDLAHAAYGLITDHRIYHALSLRLLCNLSKH